MSYSVKIDAFEGPLDLLLHLINRMEIDIYNIPVAEVTEQYLLYIQTMQDLELDVASEFLVMAATLLAIKSRMLVPNIQEVDENNDFYEPEMDPRDELVQQLLEYKKYKEAALEFQDLEEERTLLFTKPPSDLSEYTKEEVIGPWDLQVSIYDMLGAYQKLLRRQKMKKPLQTRVARQEISLEKRMEEILEQLRTEKRQVIFTELFTNNEKGHIVVTFLSILQLMKQNLIEVRQNRNLDDILISANSEGVIFHES